ncbi:alpha/beta hydrolase [Austwickia chelonae]|uniref:alpha/beta hydrolase n=1 Tax=Austwickia chelonae TaxID=100225 RepID=UPI000E2669E5|nr:alpha/beta hydrolase [Austwickia chelonae]
MQRRTWQRAAVCMLGGALVALCAGSATPGLSPFTADRPTFADRPYAGDRDPAHRLDLYLPREHSGPFPLVIFVHGGAWSFGDKAMPLRSNYGKLRSLLADHGYAVASVRYRFVDKAAFPAQLHDVKAAVRHLRAHSGELGLDPKRFAIAGDSAGGHLADLVGLVPDHTVTEPAPPTEDDEVGPIPPTDPDLEGDLGDTTVSSAVQAVVSYYGVSDLVGLFDDRDHAGCRSRSRGEKTAEGKLVRGDPEHGEGRAAATAASPLTYATRNRVPMLFLHGTDDCIVPHAQSQRLYDAVRAHGTPTELVLVSGGHSAPRFYEEPEIQTRVIEFLDRHLRPVGSG